MNFYYLIDALLLGLIVFGSYYSYQQKIYLKLFEYFKIFALITISAKLASKTGIFLQQTHFLSADSYAVTVLIGFAINILIILNSYSFVFKLLNHYVNNQKIRDFFAKTITFFEVTIIITFSLYIIMQITISKRLLQEPLQESYTYSHIKHFYTKFLNDDFVYMILHQDTKTNFKEVLFKSFKNSF